MSPCHGTPLSAIAAVSRPKHSNQNKWPTFCGHGWIYFVKENLWFIIPNFIKDPEICSFRYKYYTFRSIETLSYSNLFSQLWPAHLFRPWRTLSRMTQRSVTWPTSHIHVWTDISGRVWVTPASCVKQMPPGRLPKAVVHVCCVCVQYLIIRYRTTHKYIHCLNGDSVSSNSIYSSDSCSVMPDPNNEHLSLV